MDDHQKVKDDICRFLREGMYKKDAASMAGIDESTLYRWMDADTSFASHVEANILEYKQSLIQNLTSQAEKNAALALKILQIRWPNDWLHPQEIKDDENSMQKIADMLQEMLKKTHEEENYDFS